MALGPPPTQGEDTDTLWRYVVELYEEVRKLSSMGVTGSVNGYPVQGSMNTDGANAVLTLGDS